MPVVSDMTRPSSLNKTFSTICQEKREAVKYFLCDTLEKKAEGQTCGGGGLKMGSIISVICRSQKISERATLIIQQRFIVLSTFQH